jgi:hypothetical protein
MAEVQACSLFHLADSLTLLSICGNFDRNINFLEKQYYYWKLYNM